MGEASRAPSVDEDVALVLDLAQLSADDIAAVGGKAANLGELIRAGFDVPPGFCITTEAYRRAVRGTSVEAGTVTDAAAARAAVLGAPFPESVAAAVRGAYASRTAAATDSGKGAPSTAARAAAASVPVPASTVVPRTASR